MPLILLAATFLIGTQLGGLLSAAQMSLASGLSLRGAHYRGYVIQRVKHDEFNTQRLPT